MPFKVAIATMTGGANYGNALQNYAVLRLIEHSGYEAETLNITTKKGYPDEIPEEKSIWHKLTPTYISDWRHSRLQGACGAKNDADFKGAALKMLKEHEADRQEAVQKKLAVFRDFQKEVLKYTDFEVNNIDFNLEKLQPYAAFVTGSDQVWNPHYRTNSPVEFLQMVPMEKRIAFAPSFGVSVIPECRKQDYAKWISEIPCLSVRETEGAKIIKDLTGRDAKVLLDPTFGLTKEEWLAFAKAPANFKPQPGSYVFCYFLGNRTKAYTKYIEQYAKRRQCSVIDVYDAAQLENYSYSPREFVWLLAHANAVFTDSFHGCAFSINLQKPFVVFDRAGDGCIAQSSRITTVLGKTRLEGRKYEKLKIDEVDAIHFENAEKTIEEERREMLAYLQGSLQMVTDGLLESGQ